MDNFPCLQTKKKKNYIIFVETMARRRFVLFWLYFNFLKRVFEIGHWLIVEFEKCVHLGIFLYEINMFSYICKMAKHWSIYWDNRFSLKY